MKNLYQVTIVIKDKHDWIFSYNSQIWTVSDDAAQLKAGQNLAQELDNQPVKVLSIKVIEVNNQW